MNVWEGTEVNSKEKLKVSPLLRDALLLPYCMVAFFKTVCSPPFLYPSSYPSESWRARPNARRSRCRPRRRSHRCMLIASFSIDDGDGRENVTLKRMHSRFFRHCRA